MELHSFPYWLCRVIRYLVTSKSTKDCCCHKAWNWDLRHYWFNRLQPQGDALCRRLFTLWLNPVAWSLNATEGYRLSKPIGTKVTHPLHIDDLKVYASSEAKSNTVLRSTNTAIQDMGLHLNPKKCNVPVRRRSQMHDAAESCWKAGSIYKCSRMKSSQRSIALPAMAVGNLAQSSFWCQPCYSYQPVFSSCVYVLDVDPALARHRAESDWQRGEKDHLREWTKTPTELHCRNVSI